MRPKKSSCLLKLKRLATKEFDYPHTFKSRIEFKELSIFNVDALRRKTELQTIPQTFHPRPYFLSSKMPL